MSILYILLTFLMFVDCVILVLLVLLQLPKKEAGAGMAFGGAATDALFGAGSGNVLTKITKYAAGIFFGLAVFMAVVASWQHQKSSGEALQEALSKGAAPATVPSASPSTAPAPCAGMSLISNLPPVQTPAPAAPKTPAGTNK
jgi:preprotein translocase subunit SecG